MVAHVVQEVAHHGQREYLLTNLSEKGDNPRIEQIFEWGQRVLYYPLLHFILVFLLLLLMSAIQFLTIFKIGVNGSH